MLWNQCPRSLEYARMHCWSVRSSYSRGNHPTPTVFAELPDSIAISYIRAHSSFTCSAVYVSHAVHCRLATCRSTFDNEASAASVVLLRRCSDPLPRSSSHFRGHLFDVAEVRMLMAWFARPCTVKDFHSLSPCRFVPTHSIVAAVPHASRFPFRCNAHPSAQNHVRDPA
jgi:hypothetical protein